LYYFEILPFCAIVYDAFFLFFLTFLSSLHLILLQTKAELLVPQ